MVLLASRSLKAGLQLRGHTVTTEHSASLVSEEATAAGGSLAPVRWAALLRVRSPDQQRPCPLGIC